MQSTVTNTERQRFAWLLLAALIVFGAMCIPFFIGRVYTSDDLGAFHLPISDFYSRQLASGEPWDWMPSLFCGFYLTGEGQLGGYHPLHLLLYRTLPLGAAFNCELLLSYPFLAVGSYLFLRRIVVRRDAAAFGAFTFTFCGFNLLHFVHPNAIAIVAHLPWLLWLIEIACTSHSRKQRTFAECGIALLTGSQLLLGYPQYVWLSLLCEFTYSTVRLYQNDQWKARVFELTAAVIVGVLIGGAQVLPTFDALQSSTRQSTTAEFRSSGSLHPFNLVQLVAPYALASRVPGQNTHELGMYLGCVPLLLCYWVWLNRKNWGKLSRIIIPTMLLTLLAFVYAMGEYGPIYYFQSWLPVVRNFRFPCRAIVLIELGVAVLSAIGFLHLVRRRWPVTRELAIPLILSIAFACYAPWAYTDSVSPLSFVAIGPILILAATLLLFKSASGARWAPLALILLTAADLGSYGLSYAILRNTSDLNEYVAHRDFPPAPTQGRVAVNSDPGNASFRYGNQLALAGYNLADGYAGLEPARPAEESEPEWLKQALVDWKRHDHHWSQIGNRESQAELDTPHAKAELVRNPDGGLRISTDSTVPGPLRISERFHTGWRAELNGQVIPIVQTKSGFMECQVPAGHHTLELHFQPASLHYGLLLTACGLSFTMCWFLVGQAFQPDKNVVKPSKR